MSKDQGEDPQAGKQKPSGGVFLTGGMRVTIPKGGLTLRIGRDGQLQSSPVVIHVGLDLCPYWIEISMVHLEAVQAASERAAEAHRAGDNQAKGVALRDEFMAGMQAIVASGIAMDAFYANVKEYIDLPPELTQKWRDKRTARHKQIAETLRRAFPMSQDSFIQVRQILKEASSFRDRSVHPPPGTSAPSWHPELELATEWRFVAFRYYNAKAICGLTLSIAAQLSARPHEAKFKGLRDYCAALSKKLSPFVDKWEEKYGQLYERHNSPPE